jgi:hypothetical protein
LFTKGLFSEVKKVLDDFLLFLHKLIVLAFWVLAIGQW